MPISYFFNKDSENRVHILENKRRLENPGKQKYKKEKRDFA